MVLEKLRPLRLVGAIDVFLVGFERDFGVDDQVFAFGKVHDHVQVTGIALAVAFGGLAAVMGAEAAGRIFRG